MSEKSIIFDLDETLISSVGWKPCDGVNYKKISFRSMDDGGSRKSYWVVKRPGFDDLLEFVGQNFNVGVWSAGSAPYVEEIVKQLFPFSPSFIYNYNHCHFDRKGRTYKPLRYCPYPDSLIIEDNIWSLDWENSDNERFILIEPFIYCNEQDNSSDKSLYLVRELLSEYLVNGNILSAYKKIHGVSILNN